MEIFKDIDYGGKINLKSNTKKIENLANVLSECNFFFPCKERSQIKRRRLDK